MVIIVLHNLACCFQKAKDYDNCIAYLEAVIYHFDSVLEPKHNIRINTKYFAKIIHDNQSNYSLLGDFIWELRFSAKFHLQMCAVLSQGNRHEDAWEHAKLGVLMCEDNLIKTYYWYEQMEKWNKLNKESVGDAPNEDTELIDTIIQSKNWIHELYHRVISIRERRETPYTSYSSYHNDVIKINQKNKNLITTIRTIWGKTTQIDDWIQLLNIGNIMYLSAWTYDDWDWDSDPKYELLRDAILEKVVMWTVSYFCVATELRFWAKDKHDNTLNGEYHHMKAVEFSALFLPVSCPIVKHYVSSYYKHYGNNMTVIPEGEVKQTRIELLRSEIEEHKDSLIFLTTRKINYIVNGGLFGGRAGNGKENKKNDDPNSKEIKSPPKFQLNFKNIINATGNQSNVYAGERGVKKEIKEEKDVTKAKTDRGGWWSTAQKSINNNNKINDKSLLNKYSCNRTGNKINTSREFSKTGNGWKMPKLSSSNSKGKGNMTARLGQSHATVGKSKCVSAHTSSKSKKSNHVNKGKTQRDFNNVHYINNNINNIDKIYIERMNKLKPRAPQLSKSTATNRSTNSGNNIVTNCRTNLQQEKPASSSHQQSQATNTNQVWKGLDKLLSHTTPYQDKSTKPANKPNIKQLPIQNHYVNNKYYSINSWLKASNPKIKWNY